MYYHSFSQTRTLLRKVVLFTLQKMDGKLTRRVRRQFSLRNLKKRLNGRTTSECGQMIEGETDVDHLLENCEQIDGVALRENELQNDPKGQRQKSQSYPTTSTNSDVDNSEESSNSEGQDLNKYKIPSSMIVLNDEDKKRLEYVLLQIGLREVGLG